MTRDEAFSVLGLKNDATNELINQAFKKLTSLYDPDMHLNEPQEIVTFHKEKLHQVKEAYELLISVDIAFTGHSGFRDVTVRFPTKLTNEQEKMQLLSSIHSLINNLNITYLNSGHMQGEMDRLFFDKEKIFEGHLSFFLAEVFLKSLQHFANGRSRSLLLKDGLDRFFLNESQLIVQFDSQNNLHLECPLFFFELVKQLCVHAELDQPRTIHHSHESGTLFFTPDQAVKLFYSVKTHLEVREQYLQYLTHFGISSANIKPVYNYNNQLLINVLMIENLPNPKIKAGLELLYTHLCFTDTEKNTKTFIKNTNNSRLTFYQIHQLNQWLNDNQAVWESFMSNPDPAQARENLEADLHGVSTRPGF